MCGLCEKYGTEKIEDEATLKKAIEDAAGLLQAFGETEHIMEFLDVIVDGGDDFNPEDDADWEMNYRIAR
jgi:hypothetical protein